MEPSSVDKAIGELFQEYFSGFSALIWKQSFKLELCIFGLPEIYNVVPNIHSSIVSSITPWESFTTKQNKLSKFSNEDTRR